MAGWKAWSFKTVRYRAKRRLGQSKLKKAGCAFSSTSPKGKRPASTWISATIARRSLGWPQIGGGDYHIAHALWGGLLLLVGGVITLLWSNPWVPRATALCVGVGCGVGLGVGFGVGAGVGAGSGLADGVT